MAIAPVIPSALKERLQVAAIDFGTTFSGYAFSFRADFRKDPLKIATNQWGNKTVSLKTPSCILFSPDKRFHSFGFEAEDKYAELALEDDHHNWFYFRHFKMMLYENEEVNRHVLLKDDKGHEMAAMTVFSESIRFLTTHLFEHCTSREYGLNPDEIHWVLTVPAIWDDTAKQFMREAAITAGICTSRLTLALEPEAASLFCKYLPVSKVDGLKGGGSISNFAPGTCYLVLDAGGGTVDITIHETQRDHTVRELYKANGGPWGGTKIDEAFEEFLNDIAGRDTMEVFKMQHMDDYIELFREFEVKKITIEPDLDHKITFKMPITLHETFHELNGTDFRASLMQKHDLKDKITFAGDKLRVEPEQLKQLFKPTCDHIVSHLREIFSQPAVTATNTILMVGGFSESKMLQGAVKEAFPRMTVVIPSEAGLSVLKGAVIFGHCPTAIATRVSKYTYGLKIFKPFIPGVHPVSRLTILDGEESCKGCFDKHVDIDQEIPVGTRCGEKSYFPPTKDCQRVDISVFTSTKTDPTFADEPECCHVGKLDVDVSSLGRDDNREILVRLIYGDTELGVEAKVVQTGQVLNAAFDFLESDC